MSIYRATVVATFVQGEVEFTTYVDAVNAEQAKATLEREGYEVMALWVLELAAA